jgi:Flp pilus assembly protein TadD
MADRNEAEYYADLAERAENEGDPGLALYLWTQAVERRPQDPLLLKGRARLLVALERFTEAEQDAWTGLRHDPDDPELLLYHGSALVARAEFGGALADFSHLLALMPENPNLHVNCAEMSMWLGDYPTATAGFEAALMLDPGNVAAHFGLARVEALGGRCEASRGWLRRLVDLHNPAAGPLLLEMERDPCFRLCR